MITLDTSALVALLDRRDGHHDAIRTALLREAGSYLVPSGILAEICYFIERRLGQRALDVFLQDLEEGRFELEPVEGDLPRIRHLVVRYADLPLGFADAAVIACAERSGGRVLTLDERHFGIVAAEGRIELEPFA